MAAPEPSKAVQHHISASGVRYVVDDAGNLWQRVQGQQYTIPIAQRPWSWRLFPRPHGWAISSISTGPNGMLDCIAEGQLFTYDRNPDVTFRGLEESFHWVPIALPDSKPAPEPEAPKPLMVWNARGMAGFEQFELGEGRFILQRDQGASVSLERRNDRGNWHPVQLSPLNRFELPPGEHVMRAGFAKDSTQATIYREP